MAILNRAINDPTDNKGPAHLFDREYDRVIQSGRRRELMARRTVFVPYRPKTVLNKGKRADHWFWSRYSAYPYIGCQHACLFCCCRERVLAGLHSPDQLP
jgi:hypothetical protein